MAVGAAQPMARHDGVEAVSVRVRIQPAREFHRAQRARGKRPAEAREFVLEEAVVEARVVGDEDAAIDARFDCRGDGGETSARRAPSHR